MITTPELLSQSYLYASRLAGRSAGRAEGHPSAPPFRVHPSRAAGGAPVVPVLDHRLDRDALLAVALSEPVLADLLFSLFMESRQVRLLFSPPLFLRRKLPHL